MKKISASKKILACTACILIISTGVIGFTGIGKKNSSYSVQPGEETVGITIDYEDSPFGFHPGNANNYQYIQDLGASWSREGTYLVWDWADTNRNGNFKFKNATAPPKPDVPNSGGPVNYDAELMYVPDDIIITKNIAPFIKGGGFASEAEKTQYYNFVKAAVERYDGDDDCGCTQPYPDCYQPGDNEYPDQELIDRLKRNPVKYWQVCNQLTDACKIDCHHTYAQKFAEVQRLTYLAAKEADSTVQILIAGDSQMTDYPAVFNELQGDYIDIIDLHRFGEEHKYNPQKHLDYLKNALQEAGFNLDNLKFWITETNTYSGDPVTKAVGDGIDLPYQSEKQHARGLFKIYISDLAQGVEKVFWAWNIVEGFERRGSIFDYNGLIYDGYEWTGVSSDDPNGVYSNNPADLRYDKGAGVKKLAYHTYKLMVEKLDGSNWDNIQTIQESEDIYIYKFIKKDSSEPVWVAWWDYFEDTGCSKTITLDVGNINPVKITEAVPNAESGDDLNENDYPDFFKTETKTVNDGKITISLGESPVFIEEMMSPVDVSINKPKEGCLYIFDHEIMSLENTMIIGKITVEVNAYGENGIDKAEFFIDDVLKSSDSEQPYGWTWNELAFGNHEIKVIAYDNEGNTATDELEVIIFNLGR